MIRSLLDHYPIMMLFLVSCLFAQDWLAKYAKHDLHERFIKGDELENLSLSYLMLLFSVTYPRVTYRTKSFVTV